MEQRPSQSILLYIASQKDFFETNYELHPGHTVWRNEGQWNERFRFKDTYIDNDTNEETMKVDILKSVSNFELWIDMDDVSDPMFDKGFKMVVDYISEITSLDLHPCIDEALYLLHHTDTDLSPRLDEIGHRPHPAFVSGSMECDGIELWTVREDGVVTLRVESRNEPIDFSRIKAMRQ